MIAIQMATDFIVKWHQTTDKTLPIDPDMSNHVNVMTYDFEYNFH